MKGSRIGREGWGLVTCMRNSLLFRIQKIEKLWNLYSSVHLFWKTDLKVSNYFINCHIIKHFCSGMMTLHVSGLKGKILTCCELNGEQFKTGCMEWGGNYVYGKHMAKAVFLPLKETSPNM